jgi:streptomycin 6-kinase
MSMSDNYKLSEYLEAWHLSNPELLTQTATSHIYTVRYDSETAILINGDADLSGAIRCSTQGDGCLSEDWINKFVLE